MSQAAGSLSKQGLIGQIDLPNRVSLAVLGVYRQAAVCVSNRFYFLGVAPHAVVVFNTDCCCPILFIIGCGLVAVARLREASSVADFVGMVFLVYVGVFGHRSIEDSSAGGVVMTLNRGVLVVASRRC